jgi:Ca-activated chloride channel family protein
MLAEDLQSTQPRWRSAVEHAQQMVSELQFRGGHRVGVVVFAARPSVVVPLSTDLGFVSVRLAELNANNPPSDILATGAEGSGTRIGRALQLATGLHTPQNTLAQDIVLFTDADDPADDGDWRLGIAATREAQIPVHVVGIGDAERATQLQLSGLAAPVSTRLRNEVARSIALEGRGTYLHAGRELVDVRPWLQRLILTALTRQYEVDGIRHRIDRSAWFYGIAAVLLLAYFVVR